ncbi:MAG: hypothetical protein R2770_00800 [Acidimicrobiales bacterium]
MAREELLFAARDLRGWLASRLEDATDAARRTHADEAIARPPGQITDEIVARYLLVEPRLRIEETTGAVDDQTVDVSRDFGRAVFDRSRAALVDGTRLALRAPYEGPIEALRLQASTFSLNPPRAVIGPKDVSVYRDVPADVLMRDREKVVESLHGELRDVDRYLEYARNDIRGFNATLRATVKKTAEARRKKVLADRETEAMLGVPIARNGSAATTYQVSPVERKRVSPSWKKPEQPFEPEPAISDSDFADVIGDISNITTMFERLAVTYAAMDEERLRDQILAMLGNVYGPATGESFSKRGKSDIYLPWDGGKPVFLAECKWWSGPKAFKQHDLPQLLDRYVVWRDTHAAMILFIRNKNATAVVEQAVEILCSHPRYVREADSIGDSRVFVLHKDGDPDREIKLALVCAVIHA